MKEIWKPIPGYDDIYEVSSEGNVRSLDRTVTRKQGEKTIVQPLRGVILKQAVTKNNHKTVALYKNGRARTEYVHTLVAMTFIGERPPNNQVCHNDGNGSNNRKGNLRYDTPVGNALDRRKHGTDALGENNPRNKYSKEVILSIKRDFKHKSLRDISIERNIPYPTICSINNGSIWGHVSLESES